MKGAKPAKGVKVKTDWDAVERDYRTGKFTLRELGEKFGVSHAAVRKQAVSNGWTQDLGEAIRIATNARLTQELVSNSVDKSFQEVSNTVAIAAEANAQIIRKHQARLVELHELADVAKSKLTAMSDTLADVREVAVFVQAASNLASTTKTIIEQERKAHNLDAETSGSGEKTEDFLAVLARKLD